MWSQKWSSEEQDPIRKPPLHPPEKRPPEAQLDLALLTKKTFINNTPFNPAGW